MTTKTIKFPFYRDVSKNYGIVFSGQTSIVGGGTVRTHPIVINLTTLEVKVVILSCADDLWKSTESDIEVFEAPGGLICVRIQQYCYEFHMDTVDTATGVSPIMHTDRFNGFKLLKETIDKKSCAVSDPAPPLNISNPMRDKAIDLLLKDRNSDFVITSKDGGKFPVHSFLLTELWAYFSTAGDNLFLPYGKDSVGSMIDFFYGKDVEIKSWNSSVELLDMASVYDIPELKDIATSFMLHNPKPLTFSEAMKAWKVANESSSEAQPVFAAFLKEHASLIEDSLESTDFSETQLLELFCQIVKL